MNADSPNDQDRLIGNAENPGTCSLDEKKDNEKRMFGLHIIRYRYGGYV